SGNPAERLRHFQYFSFVTLTTLGYGDILPRTEGATALCQTEAIVGQFFMAVLVARLVGIRVAQEFSGAGDGTEE
ncbi:MAG TPA: two pore domain potassium channel family protein, partial [Desulfobulbus sp.]|nr:two pore domain potassium channel family protein [Desulfobulbus sp.]